MSKVKLLFLLMKLMLVMVLVTACGAQPQAAAPSESEHQEEAGHDDHGDEDHDDHSDEDHDDHGDEDHADEGHDDHGDEDHDDHDKEGHDDHTDEDHDDHRPDDHGDEASVELSAVELGEGEKLKVLATTNIVGDLVRNVGGDNIELITMLPIGSDPHTFTPTPQDVTSVADSHVVFINGLHLEEFLEELVENAGGEAPIVSLATNVEVRKFEEMDGHGHGDEEEHHDEEGEHHDEEGEGHHDDEEEGEHHDEDGHNAEAHKDEHDHHAHAHDGGDPHIWMTPANAMVMVHNIEHALSELDPVNAETYEANAEAYEAELMALDSWVKEQIETIPADNREMVTDHDSFGYYADRYGLNIVGAVIPATTTGAEPSAQELAELQEAIGEFDVQAIFVGTTVNPVVAERVAEDTGITLVPLYTGSLGEAGSGAETYLDYIRLNTTAIVEALQ